MREQTMSTTVDSIAPRQNWEYLVITVDPQDSLKEARRRLTEHSEYGKWELRRTLLYQGGTRRYWMRRRVMKVRSTLL